MFETGDKAQKKQKTMQLAERRNSQCNRLAQASS
jgi:hypothetical protein